jgi:hypothetical protein
MIVVLVFIGMVIVSNIRVKIVFFCIVFFFFAPSVLRFQGKLYIPFLFCIESARSWLLSLVAIGGNRWQLSPLTYLTHSRGLNKPTGGCENCVVARLTFSRWFIIKNDMPLWFPGNPNLNILRLLVRHDLSFFSRHQLNATKTDKNADQKLGFVPPDASEDDRRATAESYWYA